MIARFYTEIIMIICMCCFVIVLYIYSPLSLKLPASHYFITLFPFLFDLVVFYSTMLWVCVCVCVCVCERESECLLSAVNLMIKHAANPF